MPRKIYKSRCETCGNPLPDGATFCKACGYTVGGVKAEMDQVTEESRHIPLVAKIGIVTALVIVVALVFGYETDWAGFGDSVPLPSLRKDSEEEITGMVEKKLPDALTQTLDIAFSQSPQLSSIGNELKEKMGISSGEFNRYTTRNMQVKVTRLVMDGHNRGLVTIEVTNISMSQALAEVYANACEETSMTEVVDELAERHIDDPSKATTEEFDELLSKSLHERLDKKYGKEQVELIVKARTKEAHGGQLTEDEEVKAYKPLYERNFKDVFQNPSEDLLVTNTVTIPVERVQGGWSLDLSADGVPDALVDCINGNTTEEDDDAGTESPDDADSTDATDDTE